MVYKGNQNIQDYKCLLRPAVTAGECKERTLVAGRRYCND